MKPRGCLVGGNVLQHSAYMTSDDKLLVHEYELWNGGFSFIAGTDEAGRGCLAGPVVAAAVIFTDRARIPLGLNDSKKLSPARRKELREIMLAEPSVRRAVSEITADEIDASDILRASWKAMAASVEQLPEAEFVLVDGNPVRGLGKPSKAIVKGDSLSASIAAASILAKTHRDMLMEAYALMYPEYGFEIHKGYGTAAHLSALAKYGPSPIHRKTFAPVRAFYEANGMIQGELF